MRSLTIRRLYLVGVTLTLIAMICWAGQLLPGRASSVVGAASKTSKTAGASQKTQGAISVGIKVQPDKALGTLNLGSTDALPVAILSGPNFKAADIDPATLKFGGAPTLKNRAGAATAGGSVSDVKRASNEKKMKVESRDVNGDGLADLVAYFSISYMSEMRSGWQQAHLTGSKFDGSSIEGFESVNASGSSVLGGCPGNKVSPGKSGGKSVGPSSPSGAPGTSFCNPAPITINDNAAASPYPSTISVAALSGVISNVTVDILGFSHTFAQDASVLLVGPTGQKMILFAQASDGSGSTNVNLTFDDAASAYLPIDAPIVSGTFKPTNRTGESIFGDVNFPATAPTSTPPSPYAATLASFQNTNPNGTWSLFVVDNAGGDSGTIACGWCLNITTAPTVTNCPATLLQGSIAAGDSTQVDRLFRDGVPSECVGVPKICPGGLGGAATLRFDQYSLTNLSLASACVTVTTTSTCGTNVFATAYSGSYTPPPPGSNLCLGYLGDASLSPIAAGIGDAFSFTVAPGATFVLVVNEVNATGCPSYSLLVEGSICAPVGGGCVLTCPANITQSNDPNQCGAVVTYPAPTSTGSCGTITCNPPSGSFFPVGTTTVTCTGTGDDCTFTITVNDTQPPTITCPANQTTVSNQNVCPAAACQVANFTTTASDNCPGVVVVCNPPSGSCFPTGSTTVTCTATDASGNTATCSFTVSVFDTALEDDSDPSIILLWNSVTGQYRVCCNGVTLTGVGKATRQGCVYTLDAVAVDRRVLGRVDKAVHAGSGSVQFPSGTTRCTITDRNTLNDPLTPPCQ